MNSVWVWELSYSQLLLLYNYVTFSELLTIVYTQTIAFYVWFLFSNIIELVDGFTCVWFFCFQTAALMSLHYKCFIFIPPPPPVFMCLGDGGYIGCNKWKWLFNHAQNVLYVFVCLAFFLIFSVIVEWECIEKYMLLSFCNIHINWIQKVFLKTLSVCLSARPSVCSFVRVSDHVRSISPEPLNLFFFFFL